MAYCRSAFYLFTVIFREIIEKVVYLMFSSCLKMLIRYSSTPAKALVLFVCVILPVQALFVSPPKDPIPLIKEIFPTHSKISEKISVKEGAPLVWTVYTNVAGKGEKILGYAF